MSAIIDMEMEEGEIVDDVDGLSDISSEEEFLLRQRLEVLENYNNVLERKKAKRSSDVPGKKHKKVYTTLPDLSEISTTDFEDNYYSHKSIKQVKNSKLHKQKRKSLNKKSTKIKDTKRKLHHKKRTELVIPETSDESEDEYKNKRVKLENAVNVNGEKIDKSSLSVRLRKMICSSRNYQPVDSFITNDKQVVFENNNKLDEQQFCSFTPIPTNDSVLVSEKQEQIPTTEVIKNLTNFSEFIDLCSDDHTNTDDNSQRKVDDFSLTDFHKNSQPIINGGEDEVDSIGKNEKENINIVISSEKDSDEDLELLRQNVLKTKVFKTKIRQDDPPTIKYSKTLSDDEDSDTAELRLICLRSAVLKKAIEMKQKQRLQKRLSQSSIIQDDILDEPNIFSSKNESKNNTDTESVDMDIGSDEDLKINENNSKLTEKKSNSKVLLEKQKSFNEKEYTSKVDEFDEDEDLLRAKLLTSLSKNLPNLINPTVTDGLKNDNLDKIKQSVIPNSAAEEKKFIIELGESDSEGEHEATKNLTKMHMKLSEQMDFQQKLDLFLKSTRMEVENSKDSVIVQKQVTSKKTEKFVAKAVNNLPKSEQIEYRNLVKRMAELEKIKQSRQSSIGIGNRVPDTAKEKLKQQTVSNVSSAVYNNMEIQISTSRKKIADESAKMLKLKEEAKKLSQKYKIVATELRNITTAITLNKKQQRSVQNCLNKIRLQHQNLLKSSTTLKHSKINGQAQSTNLHSKIMNMTRLQKENDPLKHAPKSAQAVRTVKVSVLQDEKEKTNTNHMLSIQVNFTTNKKVSTLKSPVKHGSLDTNDKLVMNGGQKEDKTNERIQDTDIEKVNEIDEDFIEKNGDNHKEITICNKRYKSLDDYESPLQAFGTTSWEADPNAILCPFEVAGECKDTDCKYLHTKVTQ